MAARRPPTDDRMLRSLRGAALTLASASTLIGAAMLEPDIRGYGTHEQLGVLDACSVCTAGESRGLMTSVVHGARGNVVESLRTHAAGLPIVLALVWALVIGVAELVPRPWFSVRARKRVTVLLALAIGVGATFTVVERAFLGDHAHAAAAF
jgi:hypothetical protein